MSFRDRLSAFITEEKREDAKAVFDALDNQLDGYAADIKELKTKLRSTEGIKPEDFAAIEQERDALKKQVSELDKTAKTVAKERDEISSKYAETSKAARDYERSVILREALGKHGVGKRAAEDVGDAISYIERLVQYDDAGNAIVKYKDGETEKTVPLSDYAEKVYPTTAHAKRFIPDGNTGSGASGSTGGTGVQKKTFDEYNSLKPSEQAAFMKSGGVLE